MIPNDYYCPECGELWDTEVCLNPECGHVAEDLIKNAPHRDDSKEKPIKNKTPRKERDKNNVQ